MRFPDNFRVEAARRAQMELGRRVIEENCLPQRVRNVGGVDVAYRGELAVAAAVILDYDSLSLIESRTLEARVTFPYVPTFLSFREAPPIFRVLRLLKAKPDVLMVNGHGVAHPYGCGLASHIGVILKQPTIGVTDGLLCGEVEPPTGDLAPILYKGRRVGVALSTGGGRWIYISVGNMVTLDSAVDLTRSLLRGGKMPEPLKTADSLAKKAIIAKTVGAHKLSSPNSS
ncbi:MAG: endonuclease V [Candidatus Bathyarchaeia archaeon]